jgi:hypothetical protein
MGPSCGPGSSKVGAAACRMPSDARDGRAQVDVGPSVKVGWGIDRGRAPAAAKVEWRAAALVSETRQLFGRDR